MVRVGKQIKYGYTDTHMVYNHESGYRFEKLKTEKAQTINIYVGDTPVTCYMRDVGTDMDKFIEVCDRLYWTISPGDVAINCATLDAYKEFLSMLDGGHHNLLVQKTPTDLMNMYFMYDGKKYIITDVDQDGQEEPLLYAMRHDMDEYDYTLDEEPNSQEPGYITSEDTCRDFGTGFTSGRGENTIAPGYRLAKNVPDVQDGTIIGFYWLPLSGIMNELQENTEADAE